MEFKLPYNLLNNRFRKNTDYDNIRKSDVKNCVYSTEQ